MRRPRILKPAFWIMARISPDCPAATASGLMMENVRSIDISLETALDLFAQFRGRGAYRDSGVFHSFDLVRGLPAAAGDNRAGVAHAPSRRRGLPGHETDHRLLHVRLHIGGRGL